MVLGFWSDLWFNVKTGFVRVITGIGDFVASQGRNPIFWTIVVVVVIALFGIVYSALNKE